MCLNIYSTVCTCAFCLHTQTQCRTCVPLGIMTVRRYASASLDHTSVPAKMALPSWTMVAAALVSVCVWRYSSTRGHSAPTVTWHVVCLTSPACSNSAIDVVFLIDGSKSVRPENFELVKKWINQIIDKLDVSESKAHVGLVQYSSLVRQVRVCVWHLVSPNN